MYTPQALPEAEPGALIPRFSTVEDYPQTQALPDADSRALVPWGVSPHKGDLLTRALSHAEPGAVVLWVSQEAVTAYSCCYKSTYRVQHGLYGWER